MVRDRAAGHRVRARPLRRGGRRCGDRRRGARRVPSGEGSGELTVGRVVAIVGPTASGKTALGLRAAQAVGGEIVSADSRQVYRGMDIGTAKPTPDEQRLVRHHLIDVADPRERYDVSRYQRDAEAALAEIAARGATAFVVGGTGLYVAALLDGLELASLPADGAVRASLEESARRQGGPALHARLAALDPAAAASVDARNVRRVIRYLEIAELAGAPSAAWRRHDRRDALRIGLAPPRDVLVAAIDARVHRMVADGVLDETRRLLDVDVALPSMTAHGYLHWAAHIRGEVSLDEAISRTARDVRAYSRRQMTWWRRDADIRWIDATREDALAVLDAALTAAVAP